MAEEDEQPQENDVPTEETGADNEGGEEGSESKGGGKKKLIIFILLPILILGGAGAGLYFTGMLDSLLGGGSTTEHTEEEEGHGDAHGDEHEEANADHGGGHGDAHGDGEEKAYNPDAVFLEIPDMIVNLSTPDGAPRYLRLSVQLELATQKDLKKVEAVMPRVIDQFQTYLRELRVSDLRGSKGVYRLQMELLTRVNAAAYPVEVKDILFQEILIQ